MRIVVLALVLQAARAFADPIQVPKPPADLHPFDALAKLPGFAFGVNFPAGWYGYGEGQRSFGASLSIAFDDHHTVRANFAHYAGLHLGDLLGELAGSDAVDHRGRRLDLGIGWVYYPRALWDGFLVELGGLRRDRDETVIDEDTAYRTKTMTYGGRAMIGWSFLADKRWFLAFAVGASAGRERGVDLRTDLGLPESMTTTRSVARTQVDVEGYVRFGIAYDR